MVLIAAPSFPATTAQQAISVLRASRPEQYAYATSGVGSIPHLGVEMLALQLGARFTHVPYRSGGLMLTAIHQGEGQFGIAVLASAATGATAYRWQRNATDVPGATTAEKWAFIQAGLSAFAGRELAVDEAVYASEAASNQRNQGIAHLLHGYGRLYADPHEATDLYTRQCALSVTARDM
eukprot:gene21424-26247_t